MTETDKTPEPERTPVKDELDALYAIAEVMMMLDFSARRRVINWAEERYCQ